jgi:transposase, IS5 family
MSFRQNGLSIKLERYLLDVAHFIRTQSIKAGKILSWHAHALACIKKGKLGKDYEFGRVFQLGRIGGNYMIAMACETIQMDDKSKLVGMITEHARLFGAGCLASLGTDKGYYSAGNVQAAFSTEIFEVGIQCPSNVKHIGLGNKVMAKTLKDRRAGIEPLIGHMKQMGLRKSRMKSDTATLASGYRCVLGFNLRQLSNHQTKKLVKAA